MNVCWKVDPTLLMYSITSSYRYCTTHIVQRTTYTLHLHRTPYNVHHAEKSPDESWGSFHINSTTFWQTWKSTSSILLKLTVHIDNWEKINCQKKLFFSVTSGRWFMGAQSFGLEAVFCQNMIFSNFLTFLFKKTDARAIHH